MNMLTVYQERYSKQTDYFEFVVCYRFLLVSLLILMILYVVQCAMIVKLLQNQWIVIRIEEFLLVKKESFGSASNRRKSIFKNKID